MHQVNTTTAVTSNITAYLHASYFISYSIIHIVVMATVFFINLSNVGYGSHLLLMEIFLFICGCVQQYHFLFHVQILLSHY